MLRIVFILAIFLPPFTADAQTVVPIEQDSTHKLVFQDRLVRVFNVSLNPGHGSQFHVHESSSVGITLSDAVLRLEMQNDTPVVVRPRGNSAGFSRVKAPFTHRVVNIGESVFHNVVIELLNETATPASRAAARNNGEVMVENELVSVSRITLLPGESVSSLLPHVVVALSDGSLLFELNGTLVGRVDVAAGKVNGGQDGGAACIH